MQKFGTIMKNDMGPTELIDCYKDQPMKFEPGTKWQYCNSGYFLLGYIVEKVCRLPKHDATLHSRFDPVDGG